MKERLLEMFVQSLKVAIVIFIYSFVISLFFGEPISTEDIFPYYRKNRDLKRHVGYRDYYRRHEE